MSGSGEPCDSCNYDGQENEHCRSCVGYNNYRAKESAVIQRLEAEVERLRKLCASRPKWPDLMGRSFKEVDDATEAFYEETERWELEINAAGRGEGE